MEFWGVEVKAGEKLKVQPEFGQIIHISQASLGEVKDGKGSKNIHLRMKIDNKNFVIGTLSAEDRPQVMFDLVFEKEFELSHDWKNGSIYFMGYVADDSVSDGEEFPSGDDESEDELALEAPENGFSKAKAGVVKPAEKDVAAKLGAKDKAKKEEDSDDDEDDDGESGSDDEMALDGVPQIDSSDVSEDDSDDEEEDDESEEELPKVQQSKKRPAESADKTPVPKKAKSSTPDKSVKKGKNVTPAPSTSAAKTPNKLQQTPKSGSQVSCKSCSKTFNSENAMQSHAKAKHGGK